MLDVLKSETHSKITQNRHKIVIMSKKLLHMNLT